MRHTVRYCTCTRPTHCGATLPGWVNIHYSMWVHSMCEALCVDNNHLCIRQPVVHPGRNHCSMRWIWCCSVVDSTTEATPLWDRLTKRSCPVIFSSGHWPRSGIQISIRSTCHHTLQTNHRTQAESTHTGVTQVTCTCTRPFIFDNLWEIRYTTSRLGAARCHSDIWRWFAEPGIPNPLFQPQLPLCISKGIMYTKLGRQGEDT